MSDLSFEDIVTELKKDLIAADADLAPVLDLESEPLVKLIEVTAYRLLDVQNKINHFAEGNTNA